MNLKFRVYFIKTDKQGGGILVYVDDFLSPLNCNVSCEHELTALNIKTYTGSNGLVTVYRAPHYSVETDSNLCRTISELTDGSRSITLGDLNCHANTEAKRLDFADDIFLTQWVLEPTRENILDLVFTTEDDLINNLSVGECLRGSDHNMIRFSLDIHLLEKGNSVCKKLDVRRADFET